MKKTLLLLATFASQILFSQDYSLTPGAEINLDSEIQNTVPFGFDSTNVYSLEYNYKGKGTRIFLSKVNIYKPSPEYVNQLTIEDNERHVHSILNKNKILIFTKKYDPSAKELVLLLRECDPKTGKEIGSLKQVASLASDALGNSGREFYIKLSPNKSKMVIISQFQWKNKPQEVTVDLYDINNLSKISSNKTLDFYNNMMIENFSYVVDNDGNVVYLFSYIPNEKDRKKALGLGKINSKDNKNQAINLPTDRDIELTDSKVEITEDNNIIVGGVFMDLLSKEDKKNDKEKKVGLFAYYINMNDLSFKVKNLDYFNNDVEKKLTYTDGVIALKPCQKYYKYYGTSSLNNSTYFLFTHASTTTQGQEFEKDVIVAKYNKEGKQLWMKIIPSVASSSGSFSYKFSNNGFQMFYDDKTECLDSETVDNYDLKCHNYTMKVKPTSSVYVFIDNNGKITRKKLADNEDLYIHGSPLYGTFNQKSYFLIKIKNVKNGKVRYDFVKNK